MKLFFQILGIFLLTVVAIAADSTKPPVFQMRLVVDQPTADSEQFTSQQTNNLNGHVYAEKLDVQKKVLIDQTALKSVDTSTNFQGYQQIDFSLTSEGQKQFAEITSQNIGKRLAIFIDNKLISAPRIQSPITGGEGQITGSFSAQEAKDLAAKMSAAIAK
jgi:preprotein translocase subunit SecD